MAKKYSVSKTGTHIINGVEYSSLKKVSDHFGIKFNSLYKRYQRGKRGDDLIRVRQKKEKEIKYKLFIDGVGFKSKSALCRHYGVPLPTFRRRLKSGLTIRQSIGLDPFEDKRKGKKPSRKRGKQKIKEYKAFGKEYKSMSDIASEYGITYHVLLNRVNYYGYSIEEAILHSGKANPVLIEGKQFSSIAEAARYYNKNSYSVQARVKSGLTVREALGLDEVIGDNYYEFEGKKFGTKKSLCEHISFKYNIPFDYIYRNYNLDSDIEEFKIKYSKAFCGGYSEKVIKEKYLDCDGYFYFVKLPKYNCYKVGITRKLISERLKNERYIEILSNKDSLINCFYLEQDILFSYSDYKSSNIDPSFDGKTECLDLEEADVAAIRNYIIKKLNI